MNENPDPISRPASDENALFPAAAQFSPPAPPVYCVVTADLSGVMMSSIGPVLTIQAPQAQRMAQQSGGQAMLWTDAFPLLLQNANKEPSRVLDAAGRPASQPQLQIVQP